MQFRDHPAVAGKRDSYPVDPRALKIDPSYNVRDMQDPETIAHVRWLADSIKENGVKVPLEVRLDGEDIFIVAGHCRHAGTMLAISEGADIATVMVIPEPKGTNEVERTLNLVTSNSGKPLTPLAIAEVVRRLLAFGWTNEAIAKRLGWKSVASVENSIVLLGASADVQDMVRSGAVSASTASKVIRKEGSKAGATLKAAAAVAKSNGKDKVTSKSIKESKGEFDATPRNVSKLVAFIEKVAVHATPRLAAEASKLLADLGIELKEAA
jgi:ParB family transcriptional regulator, chromosome partitioning protein